jgi:hypothetical protein
MNDHELIKHNLLTRGYHELYEPDGVDIIEPDRFRLLNTEERSRDNGIKDVPVDLSNRITLLSGVFKTKYIDPVWPDSVYNKFIIWEGVDNDNKGWHTDMFEGYDVFMLYYLDDTFSESGGAVQFKWKESGEFMTSEIQPKKGTLVLVNNCRGFWHRAVSSTIRRRVVSFDFNVGLED